MTDKISLREFIEKRETEIKELRAALLAELRELRAAKAAIEGAHASSSSAQSSGRGSRMTIKEMVLYVLEKREKCGTSEEIIAWIRDDFGQEVVRSSLSPQLSRLKDHDEKLTLDEDSGQWCLRNPQGAVSLDEESEANLKTDASSEFNDLLGS